MKTKKQILNKYFEYSLKQDEYHKGVADALGWVLKK